MIDTTRYTRQIALEEVGIEGQERLSEASVLIVGVGGLGSPISTLLVSSGVGRVGIVDFDVVSLSNLPRQTLYTTEDIGKKKVEVASSRLIAMNPECEVRVYDCAFDSTSALDIAREYDIIVDGCDNLATRQIIDNTSKELGIPYIYGAIEGFKGQVSIFNTQGAKGYSELFPQEQSTHFSTPPAVISTTPAIIGAIEANEVIKIIIGLEDTLCGKLLCFDGHDYSINIFKI